MGFITDGSNEVERPMINRILDHCSITRANCIIVTGQDVGGGKAGGKPFEALIAQANHLRIDQSEITFVGDKPSVDIDGAKESNLQAILIYRQIKPELSQHKPDHEITDLLDLL